MFAIEKPDWSATLLWFPEGESPSLADFNPADPKRRAEPWWFVHEAVSEAVHAAYRGAAPEGHKPWILFKGIILGEEQIRHEYGCLRKLSFEGT